MTPRVHRPHLIVFSSHPASYLNYLPIPLVLLTDAKGDQQVHIAPEAFSVASAEFPDQVDFWQNALPPSLKGKLQSVRINFNDRYGVRIKTFLY